MSRCVDRIRIAKRFSLIATLWVCGSLAIESRLVAGEGDAEKPRVFMRNPDHLLKAKQRVRDGDAALQPALKKLIREADESLEAGPFSVMQKTKTPPSGDKHDYLSFGPYWWPDPDKPDGLPYIRRDGEVNPESREGSDSPAKSRMIRHTETLALAWYFTEDEKYAEHATKLLRVWFLDPETLMNPHLEYGQAIPGRTEGRDIGIIDTRHLSKVVDSIGLLQSSNAWTEEDQAGMQTWFEEYLEWLLTSDHGKGESRKRNNHGTWYDVQVASLALFVGEEEVARRVFSESVPKRIDSHFTADGRQPHELARTRSFDYSVMNLTGFFELAELAQRVDVDLWDYESDESGGLKQGLLFLVNQTAPDAEWPYKQLRRLDRGRLLPLLQRSVHIYDAPELQAALAELWNDRHAADRTQLLSPLEAFPKK